MILESYENQLWSLLDVLIACVLSGVVGYERGVHHKPAGFRTQMIVGGASALLVRLADIAVITYRATHQDVLDVDPVRIFQAIIIGVSFIGAGSIAKQKGGESIAYLTTAATLLFSTGIGISIGLSHYVLAVGATIIIIVINGIVRRMEPVNKKVK